MTLMMACGTRDSSKQPGTSVFRRSHWASRSGTPPSSASFLGVYVQLLLLSSRYSAISTLFH